MELKMPTPTVYEIAKDAYVYAYPLVLQGLRQQLNTNFEAPTGQPGQAPYNQFSHSSAPTVSDRKFVVRANLDTLCSIATLDLDAEPLVLSVPATDRYFMLMMMSAWTDVFAVPGSRTTGKNTARDFLVAGPRWLGDVPQGLELIRSPTRFAVIGGRTESNGADDTESVRRLQAQYRLTPLSAWGAGDWVAPLGGVDTTLDMRTPAVVQLAAMNASTFFARFAELLKDNPPGAHDYPIIHRLAWLGFRVGESFDLSGAPAGTRKAVERAAADARALIRSFGTRTHGAGGNGWANGMSTSAFGVSYRERAAVAHTALPENLPQDAVCLSLTNDLEGKVLDGNARYVLHFERGRLPPVEAFWSVTAYDHEGYLIPNGMNRHTLGDRDPLIPNADGSVSLFIQSDSPGFENEGNWLPIGRHPFSLMMRLYSPRSQVLDGGWSPPAVKKSNRARQWLRRFENAFVRYSRESQQKVTAG